MSEAQGHAASSGSSMFWGKVVFPILLTAILGPLIGTLVVYLAIRSGLAPDRMTDVVDDVPLLMALPFGYAAGGLQALICGGVFTVAGWFFGRLPLWLPVVIALPLAFAFKLIVFGKLADGLMLSILVHIVPALATWWLVRAYWQRREA